MFREFFIVLIKLPRHVSASKCHLQEVTLPCKLLQYFSLRFGLMWAIVRSVWPFATESADPPTNGHTERTIAHINPKHRLKNCSRLQGSVTPWRWHSDAETCRGNLMNTIKNCFEHLLVNFHRIRKNARYNGQDNFRCSYCKTPCCQNVHTDTNTNKLQIVCGTIIRTPQNY
jgi:hypothetical protein